MLTKSSLASRLSEPEMPAQQRAKMIQGAIYRTCGSHKGRMFSTGMVACDGYELRRLGRSAVVVAAAGQPAGRGGWATKLEMRSPRYTTRLAELPVLAA